MYYQDYYGLQENPFNLTADAKYLYWSQIHQNAFRHLLYSIQSNKSLIVLAGEVGTGKSTLLHVLLDRLAASTPQTHTAYIAHSTLGVADLFRHLFHELGLELDDAAGKSDYVLALKRFALRCAEREERLLLVLDEAQNYAQDVLEEFRLLSNIETPQKKLLHIILVGQPQLVKSLNRPEMYQFKQRISTIYNLQPLGRRETRTYIQTRLDVAGAQGRSFFHDDAIEAIHRYAHGIPRVINVICDNALLYNFAENKKRVSTKIVQGVVADLGLRQEPLPRRAEEAPETVRESPIDDHAARGADSYIIGYTRNSLVRDWDNAPPDDQEFEGDDSWLPPLPKRQTAKTRRRGRLWLIGMAIFLILVVTETFFVHWPSLENKTPQDSKSSPPPQQPPRQQSLTQQSPPQQPSKQQPSNQQPLNQQPRVAEEAPDVPRRRLNIPTRATPPQAPVESNNNFTIVKRGDSFEKILLETYGRYDQALISLVLKANPDISDINTIFVGQRIRLPKTRVRSE